MFDKRPVLTAIILRILYQKFSMVNCLKRRIFVIAMNNPQCFKRSS